MVTLGFLNLFHGVPYMIMVGTYCRRRWAHLEPASCGDAFTRWLTRHWCAKRQRTPEHRLPGPCAGSSAPPPPVLALFALPLRCTFLLVLVALAVVEEMLWDALVFQDYLPSLCRNMTAAPPAGEAATHSGLHFSSRFGGRGLEHTYQAGERSPRGGGGWLCDRLWGEEDGASVDDEGDEEGKLPLLDFEATGIALFTAALATPQIVHYVLDGYCWRLDRSPYHPLQPPTAPHDPRCSSQPVTALPLQVHLAFRPQPATTRVPLRRRGPRCGRGRGVRHRRGGRRRPHGGGEGGQGRELPPTRQPPAAHRGADRRRGRRVESCAPRPELKSWITCRVMILHVFQLEHAGFEAGLKYSHPACASSAIYHVYTEARE